MTVSYLPDVKQVAAEDDEANAGIDRAFVPTAGAGEARGVVAAPRACADMAVPRGFERLPRDGTPAPCRRDVAIELPVAIEVDGLGYAVLMASPGAIEDLAVGFALAERLADAAADIVALQVHPHPAGLIVRLTLADRLASRAFERVRHRASDSACGLCGVENLEQAMRPLPTVTRPFAGPHEVVFAALAALRDRQPLNAATGAVHAAALCDAQGAIRLVREDVGRHNAFDKLIGAMARADAGDGIGWDGGFALLTSRCSYELVEKAALADCPLLATISAPTSLALARAARAGLPLVTLARPDALLVAR